MLRAIIFDFDGVLVDSEPVILKITQQMAAKEGWSLDAEEYYQHYLALDDRGIVERLYRSHGRAVDRRRCEELVEWKARVYEQAIREGLPTFPGAVEFVQKVSENFPLAIASGSLRVEVEYLLGKLRLGERFVAVVTADDCARSKPEPEVYLKALDRLNQLPAFSDKLLRARECLAIEDAPGGIEAAHAAGMKCLALGHSRPREELKQADWLLKSFHEVNISRIAAGFD